ncbi:MAG: 30S ribosome-binding factor RbfA [Candidatus Competibacteraceae bacterium]
MPKEFPRTRRVGEQLRRELAQLIRVEIDDPRLVMVSITNVTVSPDLGRAKVYVTVLGDSGERTNLIEKLNHAAPRLRYQLSHLMRIRRVPSLVFIYDEVVERGARLSSLISAAVAEDMARHEPAGDEESPTSTPS